MKKLINPPTRLTRWLLTVAVFFSSLSFSGYAGNAPATHQEENFPALPFTPNFKAKHLSVSYKKALTFLYREKTAANAIKNKTHVLAVLRILIKIKFDYITRRVASFKTAERFVSCKTITQFSADDSLLL